MPVHPRAGQLPAHSDLTDISRLVTAYFSETPDPSQPTHRVAFGTSGHRGSAFAGSFNEAHIAAISQAVCDYRKKQNITGPLFLARDTHALSEPAFATTVEVLAANGVEVMVDGELGYTPTPALSHAILTYNRGRKAGLADGVVLTPSHNPPEDGGYKYNPPEGGPADTAVTRAIEQRANELLVSGFQSIPRWAYRSALGASTTHRHDYLSAYVSELDSVIDMDAIRAAGLRLAVDPLGGAGVGYWGRIEERYRIGLTVLNDVIDSTFRFMTLDWDGRIRMDCSSVYAMQSIIRNAERFDLAFACDTDHDRHGIVTNSGLMNPNQYLATCIWYLFQHRQTWPALAGVGKTMVSSSMIDRVTQALNRTLMEVPVGFKWFVPGLLNASLGFVGEESAGASFLRRDGTVWSTDKDGLIPGLLGAEMTARTGRNPSSLYAELTERFGEPHYARIDAPANPEQKAVLQSLTPEMLSTAELAGDAVTSSHTSAPGNGAPFGGVKVNTANGWFAARPSGTENVYKIYAESFTSPEHLTAILQHSQELIADVFKRSGATLN
ncbi:MAG TPA: phosphoglucomutase (alpha-D-glucose-1,6-bisphosphate-dependent) [Bryobacteraceae bacterium]|nr:phosphoglucomutase (alpha-D-glucose-1,6-bisphosphate-dependent) [Bryobacteraceae bacterium]